MKDKAMRLQALRHAFASELPQRILEMQDAFLCWFQSDDDAVRDVLIRRAHSLAGSAGTFGFPEIGTLSLEITRGLQAGLPQGWVKQRLDELAVEAGHALVQAGQTD